MTPGPLQILLILLVVLLVFGAGRLPSIAENMAKGIKSFKKGLSDNDDETPAAKKIEDRRAAEEKEKDSDKTSA